MQKLINLLGVEVNVAASSSSEEVADHRTPLGTQSGWLVVPDVVWPKQGFVQSLDNYNWSCSLFSLQCYFKLPGCVALPRAAPRGGLWAMCPKQEFVQRLDNYNWSCSLFSLQCYLTPSTSCSHSGSPRKEDSGVTVVPTIHDVWHRSLDVDCSLINRYNTVDRDPQYTCPKNILFFGRCSLIPGH